MMSGSTLDDLVRNLELAGLAPLGRGPGAAYWIAEELTYMWRDAQAEAAHAYEQWRDHPGPAGYTIYRAVQDRADAAQDALAEWCSDLWREWCRAGDVRPHPAP